MTSGQSKIRIKSGNALDVGETTSNVATNKAELAAMAANVDGKDTYPQSVSTQRLQVAQSMTIGDQVQLTDGCVAAVHLQTDSVTTAKIATDAVTANEINVSTLSSVSANLGTITGGSILMSGSMSIGVGSGNGVYVTPTRIALVGGGVTKMDLNASTGTYYFAGEVVASKVTITSNAANNVNFGANVTIGGDIYLSSANATRYIYLMSGSSSYLMCDNIGVVQLNGTSVSKLTAGTAGVSCSQLSGYDVAVTIGNTSNDNFSIYRGGAQVVSLTGDSSTVTFQGDVVINGTGESTVGGNLRIGSTKKLIFEAGTEDPSVSAGSAMTEGGSAAGYSYGSIHIGTGGSLWTVYSDAGTRKWTRVYTAAYHPA